jgi:hypothetical protein
MNTDDPGPGIYEDIPFAVYLGWPYISNSSLTPAERSMQHYRIGKPVEETQAMRLGSLIHCGKLEPLEIVNRYVVMPDFQVRKPDGGEYLNPKASAAYKAEVAEFKRQNASKEIVLQAEYDRLIGAVTALNRNARAREYLEGDGPTEVSFVWDDPATGLRCKGRCDKLNMVSRVIADLKTTENAADFAWLIKKRRYHRQGAMYQDALQVLTGCRFDFAIVAAESVDPFLVRSAKVSDAALAQGRASYQILLKQIAACHASGEWPGYDEPDFWELPGSEFESVPTVAEDGSITRF